MGIECERKFLVRPGAWREQRGALVRQGYLSRDPERTVRVRVIGPEAMLTVKGVGDGLARIEYEYAIPYDDGCALLLLCLPAVVEKRRIALRHEGHDWVVDVFRGDNEGLVVAEIELQHEAETFAHPPWLGREVTGDPRYYNASLSRCPFRQWAPRR